MQIKEVLKSVDFKFTHSLGQNFITDTNLLNAIVDDAAITAQDTVVEIGCGAGTLTRCIAAKASRVIGYEIDKKLQAVLEQTLEECDNVDVIYRDALKEGVKKIEQEVGEGSYKVVANIPYYITTPLIMMFIEGSDKVKSITVMVQKEVAERLCAKCDTREYGSITVAVSAIADVTTTRQVDRKAFFPMPNVDSTVINIKVNKNKYNIDNKKIFDRLAKSAFAMRRKTLANNLIAAFAMDKQQAQQLLEDNGFDASVRGEVLSVQQFVTLANAINQLKI